MEGLHGLVGTGFTAVAFMGNDPILASVAGNEVFDPLTAELEKAAYPCENDPQFAEFDFWIGEWDVQMANGQFAGSNVISREQRGCYLSDWTPLPDGRVRQFFEQSDDGGVTWVSWFEGFYTRKAK
ncbi:MAG: hypothetical protein MUO51_08890 [Woeseiaceae bacterium]|nr:hypothetical protein [Woeseiaceae bacterium]